MALFEYDDTNLEAELILVFQAYIPNCEKREFHKRKVVWIKGNIMQSA